MQLENKVPFNGKKNKQEEQQAPKQEAKSASITESLRSLDKALLMISLLMIPAWLLLFVTGSFGIFAVTPGAAGKTFMIFLGHALVLKIARLEKEVRENKGEYLPQNYVAYLVFGLFIGGLFNVFSAAIVAILFVTLAVIFKLNTNHITVAILAAWTINFVYSMFNIVGIFNTFVYMFTSNVWEYHAWKYFFISLAIMIIAAIASRKSATKEEEEEYEEEEEDSSEEDEFEEEEEEKEVAMPVSKQFFQNPTPIEEDRDEDLKKKIEF